MEHLPPLEQIEMKDKKDKEETKNQVTEELGRLRKRIEELEKSETERKQAEEELHESEMKFRSITASAKDAIIMVDNEGNISYWNDAAEKIFGYSDQEAVGQECHMLLGHKRYINDYRKGFSKFRKTGQGPVVGKTLELMAMKKDGTEFPIELSVSGVKLRGEWTAIGIIRDITERKKAEEEKEKLLKAIETAKEAVCITSQDGIMIYTNEAMGELFGYEKGELMGKHTSILYAGSSPELGIKQIMHEIAHKGYWEGEVHNKRKDDIEFLSYATISALKNKNGKILNYVLTQHDITKIREIQEQLVLKEKLAVLGQLAGGVGHELRNPLGAIKSAVYFLNMKLEEPDPDVKETIEILRKEVAASERIISSLLNFARTKTPIWNKINVNELVRVALSRNAVPENINMVCQLDEKIPVILADPDQLAQIFRNIVLNAIQAMPKGGELVIESKLENPEMVAISFKDTGEGIPRKHLKKLFEPLFTTKAKGIGLGLAISKLLITEHRGTIEVKSRVGKGSKFIVRLPTDSLSYIRSPKSRSGANSNIPEILRSIG